MNAALILALALALVPGAGLADAAPPDTSAARRVFLGRAGQIRVPLPRVAQGPVVDGVLDDAVWTQAAALDSFTHWEPIEGVPDSLGTVCYVLYDAQHLYAGFRCPDEPRRVRAPITGREAMWDGDWVGVDVDSYDDQRRSFYFCASPHGIQGDGVFIDGGEPDDTPDFQYRSRGRRTANGYEVEIAIPFKSLRFPAENPITFGFNAARYTARNGGFMWWAPLSKDLASQLTQYGTLQGIAGIRPGRNLEVTPTITGSDGATYENGALHGLPGESRTGLGIKYGITTSITADVAITPDFSQVEADAGVVDINQRFEISYAERRPFFLEGSDIFTTPINVVYTRRVADPLYGVKVTGKEGGTSVGALNALDRRDGQSIPTLPDRVNPYFEDHAMYNIVRIKRDVGKSSTLGVIGGSREFEDSYNRGLGLDGRFVAGRYTWAFQGLGSRAKEMDLTEALTELTPAESLALDPELRERNGELTEGYAWRTSLERGARALDTGFSVQDLSPDFAADMGYIPRTDLITFEAWAEPRRLGKEGDWYNSIDLGARYLRSHEHGDERYVGRRTDDEAGLELEFNLPDNRGLGAGTYAIYTFHEGRSFPDQKRAAVWGWHERHEEVKAGGLVSYGDAVIFDEAAPGTSWRWELWSNLQPHPQLLANLSLNGESIRRSSDGSRYADSAIPRVRVAYQYNREVGFRFTTELVSERSFATASAPGASRRHLTFDFLATYLLRPGTVAYVGYGSALSGESLESARPQMNSVFFKVSYLWQL